MGKHWLFSDIEEREPLKKHHNPHNPSGHWLFRDLPKKVKAELSQDVRLVGLSALAALMANAVWFGAGPKLAETFAARRLRLGR